MTSKEDLKLSILVATCEDRVNGVEAILQSPRPDVTYVVSHQFSNELQTKNLQFTNRKDVLYFANTSKGLSRNRNNALKHSVGDISVIADDDVRYFKRTFDIIKTSFTENKDADIVLFQIATPEHESKVYKNYLDKKMWIQNISDLNPSSIEIAFRTDSIFNKRICFNEKFGLGSKYPSSEELIFLLKCLNKGLKILYLPIPIVIHPYESSGKLKTIFSKEALVIKGLKTRLEHGLKGIFIILLRPILNQPCYKKKIRYSSYIWYSFKGYFMKL